MNIIDKLMGKKDAGAGRGFVNPKTIAEMEDEKRSPAEREAREMLKERAKAKAEEEAYNKAMPKPYKKGGMIESKRTKKFAGGGAMGSAQDMGKSLTELTGSLGTINQGLTGGGTGGGLGGALGGGFTNNLQPQPAMPDYGGYNNLQGGLSQLGMQAKVMKKGGAVKSSKMGAVKQAKPSMGSASKRADGIAQRGKTRGKMC
jgi:hypothetical protein